MNSLIPFLSRFAAPAALLALPAPLPAAPVPITFTHPVGVPNGTGGFGNYFTSPILNFTAVANVGGTVIDARVVAVPNGNATLGTGNNSGLYANFSSNTEQPNGDAALLHTAETTGQGGLTYSLEFFESGSNFTDPFVLEEFNLMVYDIDGDIAQRESIAAYAADGFTSYRLSEGISKLTVSNLDDGLNFTGVAQNFSETAINGAVILNFRNTSKIRLDFSAATTGALPNGSFAAIDGDLSFANGDFSGFGPVIPVPEPGAAGLLAVACAGASLTRRRRSFASAAAAA